MKPFYERNGITIYCGDCKDILPRLSGIDTIISDPPYGIKFDTNFTRFSGGVSESRNWNIPIAGDNEAFDPSHLLDYRRVVLWGANCYQLPLPATFLVWNKRHAGGTLMSDAEVAWMNSGHGVYIFDHRWPGFVRDSERGTAYHPTQKPAALYRWCIEKATPKGIICDPYMGAGPLLVAAQQLGLQAIGIEIDESYCRVAIERIRQLPLPGIGGIRGY